MNHELHKLHKLHKLQKKLCFLGMDVTKMKQKTEYKHDVCKKAGQVGQVGRTGAKYIAISREYLLRTFPTGRSQVGQVGRTGAGKGLRPEGHKPESPETVTKRHGQRIIMDYWKSWIPAIWLAEKGGNMLHSAKKRMNKI